MWRFTNNNQLENMAGPWKYSYKTLSNLEGNSKDFIEDIETGNVLGLQFLNGTMLDQVHFDAKFEPMLQG